VARSPRDLVQLPPPAPFDADARRHNLEVMSHRTLDVLVIGGGITGCGIALDAASRGLKVGLVEKQDFASGTSGRSSRLIHGGVRYLEQKEFQLVHESLHERAILLTVAPHLVRPIRVYVPTPKRKTQALFGAGLVIYDGLAWGRNIDRFHVSKPEEVAELAPGLGDPVRSLRYNECQTDDARLTVEVARTAARFGALIANHAKVEALLGGGEVSGATVTDTTTGESFDVRAKVVVNAGGVWASQIQRMASADAVNLAPSKGIHLVFRPGAVQTRTGLFIPSGQQDRRYIFVIPWEDRVYAGTTDTPYSGSIDEPTVDQGSRDYVVAAVARSFPGVTDADVVASWAGLRPLLAGKSGATADLSRKHAIYEEPRGLFTITGGKLTTYRAMAEDMVDRVAERLEVDAKCLTPRIKLGLSTKLAPTVEEAELRAIGLRLPSAAGRRMVLRYGDDWRTAFDLIEKDLSLGEPIAGPVMRVERELARSREMALTDEDADVRRTRLSTLGALTP
jgi:glycerol-3-phosphate dehydrogenase